MRSGSGLRAEFKSQRWDVSAPMGQFISEITIMIIISKISKTARSSVLFSVPFPFLSFPNLATSNVDTMVLPAPEFPSENPSPFVSPLYPISSPLSLSLWGSWVLFGGEAEVLTCSPDRI